MTKRTRRTHSPGFEAKVALAAIKGANLTVPAGRYEQGTREISVRAMGELDAVDTLRDLVVSMARDGSSVRLRDVEGWSAEEVVQALEISDANQRVLLHRARSRVRSELERYLDPEAAG